MELLQFTFSSPWHFLGVLVMLFIPATWRLINVDVTLMAVKPDELKDGDETE